MKLCKWAEAGGGAVKKFKKGLTAEFGSGRMLRNKKAGTVPRPHPRPEPKGQQCTIFAGMSGAVLL